MAMNAEPSSITKDTKKIYDALIAKTKAERAAKRDNNVRNPNQEITLKTELHMRQE